MGEGLQPPPAPVFAPESQSWNLAFVDPAVGVWIRSPNFYRIQSRSGSPSRNLGLRNPGQHNKSEYILTEFHGVRCLKVSTGVHRYNERV